MVILSVCVFPSSSVTVNLSLSLSASAVCQVVDVPSTVAAHSLQSLKILLLLYTAYFFFFGWAGSNGVRVLWNASPIIPQCPARLLFIHSTYSLTETRSYSFLGKQRDFLRHLAHLFSAVGVVQRTRSRYIYMHTLMWETQEVDMCLWLIYI